MALPPTDRLEVTVYECEHNGDLQAAHELLERTRIPYVVDSETIDRDSEIGYIHIRVQEGTTQNFINSVRAIPGNGIVSFQRIR